MHVATNHERIELELDNERIEDTDNVIRTAIEAIRLFIKQDPVKLRINAYNDIKHHNMIKILKIIILYEIIYSFDIRNVVYL